MKRKEGGSRLGVGGSGGLGGLTQVGLQLLAPSLQITNLHLRGTLDVHGLLELLIQVAQAGFELSLPRLEVADDSLQMGGVLSGLSISDGEPALQLGLRA